MSGIVLAPAEQDLVRIVFAVRQLMEGRSNATGTLTLAAGTTSTNVAAANCGAGSIVLLAPQSANAAAAMVTTYVAPANVSAGQFVVSHANAASTDRTFGFVCLG
jgi:hypothetical protein